MVRNQKAQSGKQRFLCKTGCGYSTTDPRAPYRGKGEPEKKIEFDQEVHTGTLVITWAQNATPVHKGFLETLQAYCKHNKAQLLVIPGRYKNPTSHWSASQRDEQWWDKRVEPYLTNQRVSLNRNLKLIADIRTQPTAVTPLSGFEGITHGESGIFGHPKLQMAVIPTPHQRMPKILTTTGACTVSNYTDTKAGAKGDFHHVLGAVVVERDSHYFHLRHINGRYDGAFCDLDKAYFSDGTVEPAGPYKAIVFGDTHVRFTDKQVERATFDKGGLVERLNPTNLVFHDLLDNYAVNPHHLNKPFIGVAKRKYKMDNVEAEVHEACKWLKERSKGRLAHVIASNHNDFFERWMDRTDWRQDPENAEFYLETALQMVRTLKIDESIGTIVDDPFVYWAKKILAGNKHIHLVDRHESLCFAGIECSLHGDQGPSGTRGSRAAISKIGVKTFIGHSHTPGITAGCYQTGTSTSLRLEYNGPIGSWLNAHGSIDPMGKRHIHIMVNGRFWK